MKASYEKLLAGNKAWAEDKLRNDPDYFHKLSGIQRPDFLWIGCSDSRVPANEVTHTPPGEIFVHRNVANIVVQTDLNLMSVLQYAVEVLEVKHVIVCGHYGCGGVLAAMGHHNLGIINQWISSIKDVHRLHRNEVDAIPDLEARNDRMVELNVQEQVNNLVKTAIIQSAWKHHKRPDVHGWAYGLKDGRIKEICTITADTHVDPIFHFDNL